jgi:hypothetical protein
MPLWLLLGACVAVAAAPGPLPSALKDAPFIIRAFPPPSPFVAVPSLSNDTAAAWQVRGSKDTSLESTHTHPY